LVNNDDPTAYKSLKKLIDEIDKYGKLEILSKRIENELKKWKGIVALVGAIITIVATIVSLIIAR
jgi:uncharacterized protein YaaR (DUF327 family)